MSNVWPAMLFNLCAGLILAWYLLRSVRRFERTADAILERMDLAHELNMQKYDDARDEIRASMRAQVDSAITEMNRSLTTRSELPLPPDGYCVASTPITSDDGTNGHLQLRHLHAMRLDETLPPPPESVKSTHRYETVDSAEGMATIFASPLPTAEAIQQLPFRARVAFAARCARRVFALRHSSQQSLPPDADELITHAVDFAERNGVAQGIEQRQAGFHVIPLYFELNKPIVDLVPPEVLATVKAAVGEAYREGGAFNAPRHAVAAFDSADLSGNISRDFEAIRDMAQASVWVDETPAQPSIFGPLWPEGPPQGWPEPQEPTTEITIQFDVPDDMTTVRAVEFAKELAAVLCSLDLAGGGHGVAIEPPLEITAPALVTVRA